MTVMFNHSKWLYHFYIFKINFMIFYNLVIVVRESENEYNNLFLCKLKNEIIFKIKITES